MAVHGTCDQRFQDVRQEFERNFKERGEVGASVCVTVGGETVVDLWGGLANNRTETPWTDETVSIVVLSSKYGLRWLSDGDYGLHGGGQNMKPKQVDVL